MKKLLMILGLVMGLILSAVPAGHPKRPLKQKTRVRPFRRLKNRHRCGRCI